MLLVGNFIHRFGSLVVLMTDNYMKDAFYKMSLV